MTRAAGRRGRIELIPDACTSCMVCVKECPVWCLSLTAERNSEVDERGRTRSRLVLESFIVDYSLCMDCGICVDLCPTDALVWADDKWPPSASRTDLIGELAWPGSSPAARPDSPGR